MLHAFQLDWEQEKEKEGVKESHAKGEKRIEKEKKATFGFDDAILGKLRDREKEKSKTPDVFFSSPPDKHTFFSATRDRTFSSSMARTFSTSASCSRFASFSSARNRSRSA